MKKFLLILVIALFALSLVGIASADNNTFSNSYGVYYINPDGEIVYLWFWTEEARRAIMGDLTAPGTNVMGVPEEGIPTGNYVVSQPAEKKVVPPASGSDSGPKQCWRIHYSNSADYKGIGTELGRNFWGTQTGAEGNEKEMVDEICNGVYQQKIGPDEYKPIDACHGNKTCITECNSTLGQYISISGDLEHNTQSACEEF